MVGVAGALWLLGFRMQLRAGQRRRERRIEEELAAYARLDVRSPVDGDAVELAQAGEPVGGGEERVSQGGDAGSGRGRTVVGGGAVRGWTTSTVEALNAWGEGVAAESAVVGREFGGEMVAWECGWGRRSFAVVLGKGPAEGGCRRAIVVPLWTTGGRMLGALAVGADGLMSVRRSVLAEALEPLEALALKVERAMENAALAERLLRAEKLAGLGLMAGGMAHALNNPLTAVLGFAELIADTTGEARVKEDAEIIVREALRMRETVESAAGVLAAGGSESRSWWMWRSWCGSWRRPVRRGLKAEGFGWLCRSEDERVAVRGEPGPVAAGDGASAEQCGAGAGWGGCGEGR